MTTEITAMVSLGILYDDLALIGWIDVLFVRRRMNRATSRFMISEQFWRLICNLVHSAFLRCIVATNANSKDGAKMTAKKLTGINNIWTSIQNC